uniref:Secreted protein n=2 Tax=Caenorhabditis tropicalis TaxID=1561998 RepID=A0A1I7T516_9PELO
MSILLTFMLCVVATSALVQLPRSNRYGIITSFDAPSRDTAIVEQKRYDRNCFFSPVQCMLSYNDETRLPLVVTRKASKRFDPLFADYRNLK